MPLEIKSPEIKCPWRSKAPEIKSPEIICPWRSNAPKWLGDQRPLEIKCPRSKVPEIKCPPMTLRSKVRDQSSGDQNSGDHLPINPTAGAATVIGLVGRRHPNAIAVGRRYAPIPGQQSCHNTIRPNALWYSGFWRSTSPSSHYRKVLFSFREFLFIRQRICRI